MCRQTTTMTAGRSNTQVVGMVVYTGPDRAAQQLSGIYASSEIAKTLLTRMK
jgi:hypothetical protein